MTSNSKRAGTFPTLPRAAFSVNEFCARLGIGRTHFYKLVKEGKIRIVQLGGRTVVPAAEEVRLLGI